MSRILKNFRKNNQSGWTLAETLIAVAIIVLVMMIVFLFVWLKQVNRGYDSKRKSDLEAIRVAFEDYYNDRGCYPPVGSIDNCGTSDMAPYLKKIPCDPQTKIPYLYVPEADACTGYHACTALKDLTDPDIIRLGCHPVDGCGWGQDIIIV